MKAMISARVLFVTAISTFAADPPALQPSVELTAASASRVGEYHVDIAVTEQPVFIGPSSSITVAPSPMRQRRPRSSDAAP